MDEPAALPQLETKLKEEPRSVKIVGELFHTYIVAEADEEVYLVDKHAAHERFIYESLKGTFGDKSPQMRVAPLLVTVSALEMDIFTKNEDLFAQAGFLAEAFGESVIRVSAVPTALDGENVDDIILEMLDELQKKRNTVRTSAMDRILYSVSCKAAVKAGQKSGVMEMEALISQLFAHTDIKSCPHGRPVAVVLTKAGIEKQFGRIV